jgi:hypothetical protein
MPEQARSGNRGSKGYEVGRNVVDRSDEPSVGYMCDGNEEAAKKVMVRNRVITLPGLA